MPRVPFGLAVLAVGLMYLLGLGAAPFLDPPEGFHAVIAETIFNLPGLGTAFLSSIQRRDYIYLQSFTLLVAASLCIANLLVDLTYTWLDPRVRFN